MKLDLYTNTAEGDFVLVAEEIAEVYCGYFDAMIDMRFEIPVTSKHALTSRTNLSVFLGDGSKYWGAKKATLEGGLPVKWSEISH